MKIKRLKLYNSVKIGSKEHQFIDTEDPRTSGIEIRLLGNLIRLKDKDHERVTYSTIFNCVYLESEEDFEEFKDQSSDSGV